jgi:hypothetical protein
MPTRCVRVIRPCLDTIAYVIGKFQSFHSSQAIVQMSKVFSFVFCLVLIAQLPYVLWEQCVVWNGTLADSQEFFRATVFCSDSSIEQLCNVAGRAVCV